MSYIPLTGEIQEAMPRKGHNAVHSRFPFVEGL